MNTQSGQYGSGDNSYQAAGGIDGLIKLVDHFFELMDTLPEAETVRKLYPADLSDAKQKLAYFLSGWLGGPRLYAEHYGAINIPAAHRYLNIRAQESESWMLCMHKAAHQQPYSEPFKHYLIEQLSIPAQRIVSVCASGKIN